MSQCLLSLGRKADQFPDHKVHHVVGVPFGVNTLENPRPLGLLVIEEEQPLLGERIEKLNHKEWIAGGLFVHQPRQRRGPVTLPALAGSFNNWPTSIGM